MLSKEEFDELNRILLQINAAIKNKRIYPADHPKAKEYNEKLSVILQEQINKHGFISFRFLENQVVFQNTPQYEINDILASFAQSCRDRKFQSITFLKGFSIRDLMEFIEVMSIKPEELEKSGGIQKELAKRNVFSIVLERMELMPQAEKEVLPAKEIYESGLDYMKNMTKGVSSGQNNFDLKTLRDLVDNMISNLLYKKSALLSLTAVKGYDEYTFCHSLNVGILSLSMGIQVSLPKDILQTLGIGGLLHDIGKITIPEKILNKSEKLSDTEWDIMRKHPVVGAQILYKVPGLEELAPVMAYEHHIKYDYSGYPKLSKNRPLSIYSMVITISDCYDAMTTERSYKKAWSPYNAILMMAEQKGKDFEHELMNIFMEMIGTYPPGSFARLDTNEYAMVYDTSKDDKRPIVKIVIDDKGNKLETAQITDLRIKDTTTGKYQRSIVQILNPSSMGIKIEDYIK